MYKNIMILGTVASIIAGMVSVCILSDDYRKANGFLHRVVLGAAALSSFLFTISSSLELAELLSTKEEQ